MNEKKLSLILFVLISSYGYSQQLLPSFFQWDTTSSRFPVTNLHFNTDSGLVQFAILSDRTGGMNPGVYEDAVQKANLLQPQFIMSVGDLINGYSTDEQLVATQWKEFNDILAPLTIPFFYVPGNHDISNAWMQQEWQRRYGKSHYYFLYKNVLFLSINSQDGGEYGMKEEQVNYFVSLIKKYTTVKWTFLFMHQPLWAKKNTGFEKIEDALQDRNYTVFAGHTHNYLLSHRNNRKYFILATTGGGTGNRGEKFGEFNHITWVTLNKQEPSIVNIKLDGLVKEDIVDEKIKTSIRPITSGNWLLVNPFVAASAHEKNISPAVTIKNPGEYPLKVNGKMPVGNGFQVQPAVIDVTVPAGSEQKLEYTISDPSGGALDLAGLSPIEIELQGEYIINNSSYALPVKKRLMIDWPHQSVKLTKPIIHVDQIDTAGYTKINYPEHVEEGWDWHGADDCAIQFNVANDNKTVFLAAEIRDDHFIFQPSDNRDKIFVYMEDKLGKPVRITISPQEAKPIVNITDMEGKPYPIKITCQTNVVENKLQLLLKIPLQNVLKENGTIRLNIGYADQDDKKSLECATLFWKPVWKTGQDYQQSGTFIIKPDK